METSLDAATRLITAHYFTTADKKKAFVPGMNMSRIFRELRAERTDVAVSDALELQLYPQKDGPIQQWTSRPWTMNDWLSFVRRLSFVRFADDNRTLPEPDAIIKQARRCFYVCQMVYEAVQEGPSTIREQHLQHGWKINDEGKIALDYGTATASAAHTTQPARAQQSVASAGQLQQQQGDKGCSCKKSKCCTRQCACFKNGKTCGPACKCIACENKDLELIQQAEDSDSVDTPSEGSVLGDDYSVADSEGLQNYPSSEEFMPEDVEEYSEYSQELMEVPLEELLLEEADAAEQS